METDQQVKWKSNCLRLGLLPFKAYVIGVPIILVLWLTQFREGRGWETMQERQYFRIVADIFASVEHGYLACAAGLLLALGIGYRIRDESAVRASLIYGLVTLFCLFWSYQLAQR
jgi:hypothetical protein